MKLVWVEIATTVEWIIGGQGEDGLLLHIESGLGPEPGEAVLSGVGEWHPNIEGLRPGVKLLEAVVEEVGAHEQIPPQPS